MSYYVTNENSVLNINNAHLKVSGNIQTDVMKLGAIEFAPPASDLPGTVNFTNVTTGVTTTSNLNVGGTLMLGSVELVTATAALEQTVNLGNVTSNTVQFTNPTTSLVASGNVVVTGNVTADHFVGDGSNITGISSTLQAITDSGPGANVTSNTVQFSNAITSLTATSNIEVAGFVGSSGTGALTLPSGTTAQQPSTGLVEGMIRYNSTLTRIEYCDGTVWKGVSSISATGGTVTNSGSYRIHKFTTGGTFTVTSGGTMDYLIVGGGGGGGGRSGGGGGAGGLVYQTGQNISSGTYTVVVGSGGGGGSVSGSVGGNGTSSSIFSKTALGGGGGGSDGAQGGRSGGSGGGGRYGASGGASTQNSTYGYGVGNTGGGSTGASTYNGGGGGGAGAVGQGGTTTYLGDGGNGLQYDISGTNIYYAGGGGGGSHDPWPGGASTGGLGGGGASGTNAGGGTNGVNGGTNTGGGGGGGSTDGGNGGSGGNGGTGVVIIRYTL